MSNLAPLKGVLDTVTGWFAREPFFGGEFDLKSALLSPFVLIAVAMILLEILFPLRKPVFGKHNILTSFYFVLGRKVGLWLFFVTPLTNLAWTHLHLPSLNIDRVLTPVSAFLVGLLVATFSGYWAHRWLHRFPLLWHLHKVHHAPTHVYWATRFHEHFAAKIVGTPMLAVITRFLGYTIPGEVGLFIVFMDSLEHCNVRVRFGWLNYILILPEVHRFHHSTDPIHYNKNYGAAITLWDWLFGTYLYDPTAPATKFGLDEELPTGYFRQQIEPLLNIARDVRGKIGQPADQNGSLPSPAGNGSAPLGLGEASGLMPASGKRRVGQYLGKVWTHVPLRFWL